MAITSNVAPAAAPSKQTLATAYIDFTTGTNDWAQQYLPDLMEKEAEIFGNRTISGFLSQVGAEESMTSDQVVWSEQSRLHLSYECTLGGTNGLTLVVTKDADGVVPAAYTAADVSKAHGMRAGDMLLVADADKTVKAYVSAVATDGTVSIQPYGADHMTNAGIANGTVKVLVFGSEYSKGGTGRDGANAPSFKHYDNKPIILKDKYEISGSDASQIGWVEVTGEEGQTGYLWYLKAEGDTRARFTDYLEMAMIESEKATGSGLSDLATLSAGGTSGAITGTEGLFAAIEARGNETTGVTGVNAATDLAEFDAILAEFDKNGAIEENMMFLNRSTALAIDDMLASMNSYGAGGTSYGVFDNDEDMALNLGFSGFRRGSYDFYKSDWKYLNDSSTRGLINSTNTVGAIRGVMIPAGVSSVYDQTLGKNLKRPFLHVRYRASQTDDRRMKTWTTGSVGATTSDLDAMEVHYLSERCLIVQGANNFMLMN
tara:strand:- start:15 stop:1475 length:1461 start_codon:yes stop_codon:yes gene_type:complete